MLRSVRVLGYTGYQLVANSITWENIVAAQRKRNRERNVSKLVLALLGPPRVTHGGRPLRFRSRKELGLLLYLAAEGGTHAREKLADLFWPESGERAGRAALRNALSGLQRTLKEYAGSSGGAHLLITRDALGFDFALEFDLDLQVLKAASSQTGGERREVISRLRAAVEAYRGDFLEGFYLKGAPDLDYWIELERETWRERVGEVYDRLSRLQMEGGEVLAGIEVAARWVAQDPLNEAASRRLMEARLAAGDRDGALRAYERYRTTLEKELGTEPGPEVEELVIRARLDPRRAQHNAPGATRHPRGSLDLPLVGRAPEFGVLVSEYHAACEGQTRIVAVVGEAGIGKTRLSNEFLGWAAAQGADVLRGRAFETGGGLPYGPVVDALRERIDRERAPDDLLPDVWLSELSRLLPELRERYPDLPASASDEATARGRLFEAVACLVGALAERALVTLFVDDFHRADTASLDVLRYACGRWAESGASVMLIVGLRSEALESDLAGWLNDLGRDLPVERVSLDALTGEDTTELLRALAPEEPGGMERLGRWLYAETDGQPFYVVEMIQSLFEEGVLVAGESIEVARDPEELGSFLPSRVREVVRVRIERLGPVARELLTAGAVLGEGFSFEHLHRVAQIGEGEALRALDEALGTHLLREAGMGYGFAHDKIGEVVYTEAGDARRRVFHRRALTILEEEDAPPAALARHAFAARLAGPAFRHSIAAGDGAMELFAARDAISHYERARRLMSDSLERLPVEEIEQLYVNLGRAREVVGEWDEAGAVYEAMLAYAREEREPSLEWAALNRMAILHGQRFFDMDAAVSLTREALEVAKASGDRAAIAETEWNLTQMAALGWRMDEAFDHGERTLSLARELGLVELEARTRYILGISCLIAGRFEENVAYAGKAAALYATVDSRQMRSGALSAQFVWAGSPPSGPLANRAMEVFCLAVLALGEINRGEPRRAVDAGRKAYETGRGIQNDWTRVFGGACLAHGLIELGEYAEALRLCEEVLQTARYLPNPIALYFTLFPLIDAYQGIWSLQDARAACLEALALGDRGSVRTYRHIIVSRLCANRALARDWEEAHAYARESAAARDEVPVPLTRMDFVRHHETEALLRGGDGERARQDVQALGERVGDNRRFRVAHLRASSVISRWDNKTEQAIEQLSEAEALSTEAGLRGELWQIRAELGDLYGKSGQKEQATQAYAKAAEVILSIVSKLEDKALREGFLASPRARSVLERSC